MTLAENLKRARAAKEWSQTDLSKESGVSQSLIAQLETGEVKSTKFVYKLADALNLTAEELDPNVKQAKRSVLERITGAGAPRGHGDLPVYASAEGGSGGIIIAWDPIEFVVRPEVLATARDAYAIYIVGDSMEPAFERGDLVYVNPHVQGQPGKDAVFFRERETETHALIKRIVRITAKDWIVKQYNPAKEFELPRSDWRNCQKVVGKISA